MSISVHQITTTYQKVNIKAQVNEQLHHLLVAVPRGEVQRRVRRSVCPCSHHQIPIDRQVVLEQVKAHLQQQLNRLQAAVLGGQVEGRLRADVPNKGVGSLAQQQRHHRRVPVLTGRVQCRLIVLVLQVDVGTGLVEMMLLLLLMVPRLVVADQQLHHLVVTGPAGQVQR